VFIKGRLRGEMQSWVVRSVVGVYRPVLGYFLDRPAALVWLVGVTFLVGLAPLGSRAVLLTTLAVSLVACAWLTRHWLARAGAVISLVVIALLAEQHIRPTGREFMTPLDEGMTMDMPITVPRASVTQSADDLKARDMVFCRFPEVDMVVGKAGRAETPTDPAPLDMIETMVNFRPAEFWPKRKLRTADAERQAAEVLEALVERGLVRAPGDAKARAELANEAVMAALPLFDAQIREYAYQRNKELERELSLQLPHFLVERVIARLQESGSLRRKPSAGDVAAIHGAVTAGHAQHLAMAPDLEVVTALTQEVTRSLTRLGLVESHADLLQDRPDPLTRGLLAVHTSLGGRAPTFFTRVHDDVRRRHRALWTEHVDRLNDELLERAPTLYTRLVLEEFLGRMMVSDRELAEMLRSRQRAGTAPASADGHAAAGHTSHFGRTVTTPAVDPIPVLDTLQRDLADRFGRRLLLWPKERTDLAGFGGELDRVMQMPGWTNVWTMPIQNRVDMLATGVNTTVGVRVLGRRLDDVVRASEEIAAVLKHVPGAADVVADPVRGKGYLEVHPDRGRAAALGVSVGDINDAVETAVGGKVVTTTVQGRERHPVRLRYPRAWREDEESVRDLLVPARTPRSEAPDAPLGAPAQVPLADVADVRIVEGPATIKGENGLLRNYVRLNVRGRDGAEFVDEARRVVADRVELPAGVYVEWTGQFEHEAHARHTLLLIVPLVVGLIFLILYLTYHDLADAILMLLAVPGAIAGGVFCQWLFGYKFSVTVWVGYIACFGMATSTGIIMLVYLREAVARAGDLGCLTLEQLRQAVMDGAVQRLRPKLLTECTTVLGLAPLLVATGTGAEVIRPMVVPVLGGILVADEVIDLFLPVLFFWVRRRRWQRLRRHGTAALSS
jgi:Cu(I)/Ag(I) efflux system membrane protein CusA/SilA